MERIVEIYNPKRRNQSDVGEVYDPKAKKRLDAIVVNDVTLKLEDRVRYVGSSPCFVGKSGVLKRIRKEWASARQMSRAGFRGYSGRYSYTIEVLWDGTPTEGPYAYPQGCNPDDVVLA